jgi:hypothetical protein
MSLSINTASAVNIKSDENESPLGKRKTESPPVGPSPKRSPLSNVGINEQLNESKEVIKASATPSKNFTVAPYSASKFRPRVSKEEIQATDEGRASVDKLSQWLATESAKKPKKPPTIVAAPVRFRMKPKLRQEDVEATDDKRVSVKTLSAWISDDPFEQKKLRHIRSGAKVIAKSRVFESDKALAASRKVDIKAGSVHERQAWLSGAFKHEEDGECRPKPPLASNVPRPYQNKVKKEESPEKTLKTVKEKKEWLNNAFKKNDQSIHTVKSCEGKADTLTILKCASADEAHMSEYPSITQQTSCDAMDAGGKSSVRLYQNSRTKKDSPEKCLQSVHDKQAWLSNAFKKPRDETSVTKVKAPVVSEPAKVVVEKKLDAVSVSTPVSESLEENKVETWKASPEKKDNAEEEHMSVADRAKWLRGAFNK